MLNFASYLVEDETWSFSVHCATASCVKPAHIHLHCRSLLFSLFPGWENINPCERVQHHLQRVNVVYLFVVVVVKDVAPVKTTKTQFCHNFSLNFSYAALYHEMKVQTLKRGKHNIWHFTLNTRLFPEYWFVRVNLKVIFTHFQMSSTAPYNCDT